VPAGEITALYVLMLQDPAEHVGVLVLQAELLQLPELQPLELQLEHEDPEQELPEVLDPPEHLVKGQESVHALQVHESL
jgi:hypothetical protein